MTRRMAASVCGLLLGTQLFPMKWMLKVFSRDGSRVVLSRRQDIEAQTVKTEDAHGEVILQYQVLYLLKHARMSKLRRRKS